MAKYSVAQGFQLQINIPYDYQNQGWEVRGGIAYHNACNAGIIKALRGFGSVQTYTGTFRYTILTLTSGIVRIGVNGQDGIERTAPGTYEDTFTITAQSLNISFYADGNCSLSMLEIFDPAQSNTGTTLMFNEDADKWVTYYDYKPEWMVKFITNFFSFNNGSLWLHNSPDVPRNNFYGSQYTSKIGFVFNDAYTNNKILYNIRLDSKGNWSVPIIQTEKNDKFPNGMQSRIKSGNFKLTDGKKWADFLRDMNDPSFSMITDPDARQLKALLNGRELQGCTVFVELETTDTTEAKISSVEIFYSETSRPLGS